mmetsp:Transcript_125484/g.363038  ORF Transcript_125484/g.363038 Transcript_125484/m.363038 type:complete len:436 (+) Transcript_125484:689-1996(+)
MPICLPTAEEGQARHEVRDIRGQRLQRWEGNLHPEGWPRVAEDAGGDLIQIRIHDDEALHGLANICQGGPHANDELVEAQHLLVQHGIQGLMVIDRIPRRSGLNVERWLDIAQVLGAHLGEHLFLGLAALTAPAGSLHRVGRLQHGHHLVDGAREIGIRVQAEDLRVLIDGQASDVLHVPLSVCELRRVVNARWRELVVLLVDVGTVEVCDDRGDGDPIVRIRHSAAVVRLGGRVLERFVWHDRVLILQEDAQLVRADLAVGLRELVRDVPAQRSEVASLLDEAMEEEQAEQHLAECMLASFVLGAGFVEPLLVQARVCAQQIGLQTLWWLHRHLHAVLEDTHGKLFGWHRGEPQAEIRGYLLRVQLLYDRLQLGHPRHRQVAILKDHPKALLLTFPDRGLGFGPLALAEGHSDLPLVHVELYGQFDELRHGICS